MNQPEFNDWLRHHSASFPSFAQWLHKQPNRGDIKQVWERIMSDVSLSEAMKATDAMACGDVEPPRGFGDHVRAVRLLAKGYSARRTKPTRRNIDGQPTYACKDCEDSGVLYVFHPKSMREQETGELKRDYMTHIGRALPVKCDCEAGKALKAEMPPSINRKTMVPMVGSIDSMFDALKKFIDAWKQQRVESKPTFSPSLAEWSR